MAPGSARRNAPLPSVGSPPTFARSPLRHRFCHYPGLLHPDCYGVYTTRLRIDNNTIRCFASTVWVLLYIVFHETLPPDLTPFWYW